MYWIYWGEQKYLLLRWYNSAHEDDLPGNMVCASHHEIQIWIKETTKWLEAKTFKPAMQMERENEQASTGRERERAGRERERATESKNDLEFMTSSQTKLI